MTSPRSCDSSSASRQTSATAKTAAGGTSTAAADPWQHLRAHTAARIALGRAGAMLPTQAWLHFKLAHAYARDAVHTPLDASRLLAELKELGARAVEVATKASDRRSYLAHPELGRFLADADKQALLDHAATSEAPRPDLALIIADGLSATAVETNALAFARPLMAMAKERGLSLATVVVARHARVALQDDVGAALKARCAVIAIGERPGLASADSLGAYYVLDPQPGRRTDAQRNCVSNIRSGGLEPAAAAAKVFWLIQESLRLGISGVALKDAAPSLAPVGDPPFAQVPRNDLLNNV